MPWVVDAVAGVILAVLFYLLVRLRMTVAPRLGNRFGPWARWSAWVVIILIMIIIANLELMGLRQVLHDRYGLIAPFMHELLFAAVAFGGGFYLVVRHVTRNRGSRSSENETE